MRQQSRSEALQRSLRSELPCSDHRARHPRCEPLHSLTVALNSRADDRTFFLLSENECIECPSLFDNAEKCTATGISKCASGFFLHNGVCSATCPADRWTNPYARTCDSIPTCTKGLFLTASKHPLLTRALLALACRVLRWLIQIRFELAQPTLLAYRQLLHILFEPTPGRERLRRDQGYGVVRAFSPLIRALY